MPIVKICIGISKKSGQRYCCLAIYMPFRKVYVFANPLELCEIYGVPCREFNDWMISAECGYYSKPFGDKE